MVFVGLKKDSCFWPCKRVYFKKIWRDKIVYEGVKRGWESNFQPKKECFFKNLGGIGPLGAGEHFGILQRLKGGLWSL